MNYIEELLNELSARLPELEWKISHLKIPISAYNLPKGLFRTPYNLNSETCMAEIKSDIAGLAQQKNQRSAMHIASRINSKINVLVTLCQMYNKEKPSHEKVSFGIKMISTRQQWIESLELNVATLAQQQQAMLKALDTMQNKNNDLAVLSLKKDLGEIERHLTLAKESLQRVIGSI